MRTQIATLTLAGLLAACSAQTTTPIQSMSEDGITVAYVNGFAGTKDTDKVARMHCATPSRAGTASVSDALIDETAVHYAC